jgi:histone acetyltransferase (RNA polymerase elongator complex component)
VYEELYDSGLVRELHVYGQLIKHDDIKTDNSVQHQGLGKKLLKKAEEICLENDIYKVSIISGVGVRDYYRKNGYSLENNYMAKYLYKGYDDDVLWFLKICIIIVFISILY